MKKLLGILKLLQINMTDGSMYYEKKLQLDDVQHEVFKIQSLAKVLKLAIATTYVSVEVDDEDVQQVAEIIEDITENIKNKILELM